MNGKVEARLTSLGFVLPDAPSPVANYVPAFLAGNLLFISGQISKAADGSVAKLLHWLIFLMLAAQYAVGSIMPHIGRDTLNEGWVNWHLSIGAAILFAIVLRFLWRLTRPVRECGVARIAHLSLYLLIFAMTMLGWAAANYRGWTVMLFGAVPLPALAPQGAAWAHEAGDIHNVLVYVLLGVILLHVAAALYHYAVLRDQVLQRMLTFTH